jgi:hypothetical protein
MFTKHSERKKVDIWKILDFKISSFHKIKSNGKEKTKQKSVDS